MLGTPRRTFRNIVGHVKGVTDLADLTKWANEQFDPLLDWNKAERIRDQWGGKLILKGILDADDARMAADVGADAMIVSNHGGRQLDGALSSIRVLPSIVRAVGDQTEIYLDSGIRSGQDVLKALALGAKSTFIGRSYIYGLGAMGQAGVTKALEVIQKELDISMALCGASQPDQPRACAGARRFRRQLGVIRANLPKIVILSAQISFRGAALALRQGSGGEPPGRPSPSPALTPPQQHPRQQRDACQHDGGAYEGKAQPELARDKADQRRAKRNSRNSPARSPAPPPAPALRGWRAFRPAKTPSARSPKTRSPSR